MTVTKTLGIFHVLTGPDHLSALATLSANTGPTFSFLLGLRWGLGHSSGLLAVGIILILVDKSSGDSKLQVPQSCSILFETLVGIFMLALGSYGLRKAIVKKRSVETGPSSIEVTHSEFGCHRHVAIDELDPVDDGVYCISRCESGETILVQADDLADSVDPESTSCCVFRLSRFLSTGTMALSAGILHGMAGPGGVLGVIPAVKLHDPLLSTIYLGCFCVSSTVTMGIFASVYGSCSSKLVRNSQHVFLIECVSSSLSLLVGVLWIALLSFGKLDDVFP